ncbi:sensor histidine kinase [Agaribacter marinus]|uniref:histidine kinase n=1 Tax=Agaribacter marinus TaxID=1431249 RepID=A0AA37SWA5_9ALTE|nr:HAMP domain-containing sensor histidine kinase [Agaribacter marinus]GLR70297.1 sensor histidine kinase [Agaribacter marinus]
MSQISSTDAGNAPEQIEFTSVIAVAIHDMKNSLSLLMQSIEQMANNFPDDAVDALDNLNSVHYEANRMNTTLVQVLSLYKASVDALPINVDEVYVCDLIEELIDSNAVYVKQKDIQVLSDVDEDLSWYFDRDLVYMMVYDVIINAIRYGCSKVSLKAFMEDQRLTIQVEDDGPGYPSSMLEMSTIELTQQCISEGRTGLGLFFARLIAQTHKNQGKQGSITLANSDITGGSIFTLQLP